MALPPKVPPLRKDSKVAASDPSLTLAGALDKLRATTAAKITVPKVKPLSFSQETTSRFARNLDKAGVKHNLAYGTGTGKPERALVARRGGSSGRKRKASYKSSKSYKLPKLSIDENGLATIAQESGVPNSKASIYGAYAAAGEDIPTEVMDAANELEVSRGNLSTRLSMTEEEEQALKSQGVDIPSVESLIAQTDAIGEKLIALTAPVFTAKARTELETDEINLLKARSLARKAAADAARSDVSGVVERSSAELTLKTNSLKSMEAERKEFFATTSPSAILEGLKNPGTVFDESWEGDAYAWYKAYQENKSAVMSGIVGLPSRQEKVDKARASGSTASGVAISSEFKSPAEMLEYMNSFKEANPEAKEVVTPEGLKVPYRMFQKTTSTWQKEVEKIGVDKASTLTQSQMDVFQEDIQNRIELSLKKYNKLSSALGANPALNKDKFDEASLRYKSAAAAGDVEGMQAAATAYSAFVDATELEAIANYPKEAKPFLTETLSNGLGVISNPRFALGFIGSSSSTALDINVNNPTYANTLDILQAGIASDVTSAAEDSFSTGGIIKPRKNAGELEAALDYNSNILNGVAYELKGNLTEKGLTASISGVFAKAKSIPNLTEDQLTKLNDMEASIITGGSTIEGVTFGGKFNLTANPGMSTFVPFQVLDKEATEKNGVATYKDYIDPATGEPVMLESVGDGNLNYLAGVLDNVTTAAMQIGVPLDFAGAIGDGEFVRLAAKAELPTSVEEAAILSIATQRNGADSESAISGIMMSSMRALGNKLRQAQSQGFSLSDDDITNLIAAAEHSNFEATDTYKRAKEKAKGSGLFQHEPTIADLLKYKFISKDNISSVLLSQSPISFN